ncbi:MAG: CDP-alcohol phosphatidyltransferase family protein [Propionibacteriaceae bacterium]
MSTLTVQGYGATVRELASAQKSAKGAPGYSRFINRPFGRRLAALAFLAGLTPNAVTAISAVCTFSAIILLAVATPGWGLGIGVTVLLVVGYALDSADGQVARLRGGGSLRGEWLDHMVDAAKITSLHLAIAIGVFRVVGPGEYGLVLVPVVFAVVNTVLFFGMILNELLRARHQARGGYVPSPATAPSTLRALVLVPVDYGFLCLIFVLLGVPALFFGVYALLLTAYTAFLLLAVRKWFVVIGELDGEDVR